MTYKRFKSLVSALLIQDVTLTEDNDELLGLLEYAYNKVAMEADSVHLTVLTPFGWRIARQITENQFIRFPNLPETDEDELDIDESLVPAIARYVCSFVSTLKTQYHEELAKDIIRKYNQEIESYIEKLEQYGYLYDQDEDNQSGVVLINR